MTPEREGRFSLRPSPRKRQRRTIRSFADAVVRRRAMQARVEVEVGFVDQVRLGAKDGSEVGAGNSCEERGRDTRRAIVLLLHRNAAAVGQRKGGDVGLLAQPISDRLFQFDEPQDDFAVAFAAHARNPHEVDHRRLDLDEALVPVALHEPPCRAFERASRRWRHRPHQPVRQEIMPGRLTRLSGNCVARRSRR
jgi:hypothetical protein